MSIFFLNNSSVHHQHFSLCQLIIIFVFKVNLFLSIVILFWGGENNIYMLFYISGNIYCITSIVYKRTVYFVI